MVNISQESPEETEQRLRRVIAEAHLSILDGDWCFLESPISEPPVLGGDMLAVVRDEDTWSWLVRAVADATEQFAVFSLHFPAGLDNSGFVGWLATELKRRLGTGVFVVCGQNSHRGGIYDYWGCPTSLRDAAIQALSDLRTRP